MLITRHRDREASLGFAPHGAGQNMSRSAFVRPHVDVPSEELLRRYAPGVDLRSYCGALDVPELPGAYKTQLRYAHRWQNRPENRLASRRGCAGSACAPSRGSNEGSAGAVS